MRFYITFEFKGKTPHYSVYPSKCGNKVLWSGGYKLVRAHFLSLKHCVMPIHEHKYLIPIDENQTLWRYMSLEKFESLLQKRSLFFCRADKFSDPFECSTPKREFESRKINELNCNGHDENAANRKVQDFSDFFKRVKKSTVVNCWHISEYESDGMWQLYLKTNEGIAIQSNFKRIRESLINQPEIIYASKVRYIDYEQGIWHNKIEYPVNVINTITPVIHKRIEFAHESEFRLFFEILDSTSDFSGKYWENQENRIGKFVSVDPDILIDKVFFAPTVDEEGKEYIKEIVRKLGYDLEFQVSSLTKQPNY